MIVYKTVSAIHYNSTVPSLEDIAGLEGANWTGRAFMDRRDKLLLGMTRGTERQSCRMARLQGQTARLEGQMRYTR